MSPGTKPFDGFTGLLLFLASFLAASVLVYYHTDYLTPHRKDSAPMATKNKTAPRTVDFPSDRPVAPAAPAEVDLPTTALDVPKASAPGAGGLVSAKDFMAGAQAAGFRLEKYFSLAEMDPAFALTGVYLGEAGFMLLDDLNNPEVQVEMPLARLRVAPNMVIKIKRVGELNSLKPGDYICIMKGPMVKTRKGFMAQDWSVAVNPKGPPAALVVDGDIAKEK